jgi:hypothetical protein
LGLVQAKQSSTPARAISAGTGSVMGYIVYNEIKLPARFAEIHLEIRRRLGWALVRIESMGGKVLPWNVPIWTRYAR